MPAPDHPNLSVSQNFIKDPRLAAALVERSSLGPGDLVYEIGPGRGILTAELVRRCRHVVAVEKDPALAALLRRKFARRANLELHGADFLDFPLPDTPYKVFANIPFNLTSAIITRLTEAANPPEDACLVVQKEAAEMLLGRPQESLRSILLQPWFALETAHTFRRSDFTPRPRVDCVLLRFRKRVPPRLARADRRPFRDFVVFCFTAWRPTLDEILKELFTYNQRRQIRRTLDLDLQAAPTELNLEAWLALFETFKTWAAPPAARRVAGSEKRLRRRQAKLQKIHRTRAR